MPPVDPRSYKPKFVQIADSLRGRIRSGEFQPGEYLRSEKDLADEYDVAPATVRRALRALKAEGLITTEQGVRAQVVEVGERAEVELSPGDHVVFRAATLDEQRELNLGDGAWVAVVTGRVGAVRVLPATDVELVVPEDA